MMQSSTFYGILISLLGLVSDTNKVKTLAPVAPPVVAQPINLDSAIAVQEYIAVENLEFLKQENGK